MSTNKRQPTLSRRALVLSSMTMLLHSTVSAPSVSKFATLLSLIHSIYTNRADCMTTALVCADGPMEVDSLEIQQAVSHIAEAALLGVGDANKMFPESLEEMYESYGANEMEFRVIL